MLRRAAWQPAEHLRGSQCKIICLLTGAKSWLLEYSFQLSPFCKTWFSIAVLLNLTLQRLSIRRPVSVSKQCTVYILQRADWHVATAEARLARSAPSSKVMTSETGRADSGVRSVAYWRGKSPVGKSQLRPMQAAIPSKYRDLRPRYGALVQCSADYAQGQRPGLLKSANRQTSDRV